MQSTLRRCFSLHRQTHAYATLPYINGTYYKPKCAETFPTVNPANGETLSVVSCIGAEDMDHVIQSSSEGLKVWSKFSGAERSRILHKAATLLRKRNDELAELEVRDSGKPIAEAKVVDVVSGADCIEYYANLAGSISGEYIQVPGGAFAYTRREPVGICAGIGAWNYPLQIACWKSAPALACGNSMIYKPSEMTPLTAGKLAEVYTEAGVPPGVFNVVQGKGATGALLANHPAIRKISLTGSVETGKRVMGMAAGTLKNVTMELGGKSPLIVFEDADVEQAVSAALMANFFTQGEICSNGTRVFVHNRIKDYFLTRVIERTRQLTVGDPLHPDTHVGALISQQHMQKVLGFIQRAKAEGARIAYGGDVVQPNNASTPPVPMGGNFVTPCVIDHVTDNMEIAREEVFGPVMSVLTFDEETEVVGRANATPFGLAGAVFTKDITRAHRVAAEIQAGVVWINNYNITPVEVPFGGMKLSGIGRENGRAAVDHYTVTKTVYVEMNPVQCPYPM